MRSERQHLFLRQQEQMKPRSLSIAMHKDAVRRFKRAHEELEDAVDLAIALKERIEASRASSGEAVVQPVLFMRAASRLAGGCVAYPTQMA